MKRDFKVKMTGLFLIIMFVVISIYSLFITKVGDNDYFYQIKNDKIELAKGFCWGHSLHPIKLEHYFSTSFEVNLVDRDTIASISVLGKYILSSNKTGLIDIFNKAKLPSALEVNGQHIDCDQYAIDQEIIKRIQKIFNSMPESIFLSPNYKSAISGALNEIIPQQGIEKVTFLCLDVKFLQKSIKF